MRILDRAKMTAVQSSNRVFSLSASSGYPSLPSNEASQVVIFDNAGNFCVCEGTYVAPIFTVDVVDNGSSGLNVPTFSGSIEVVSTLGGKAIERDRQGMGGLIFAGQSNATGWATGSDPLQEFDDPRIIQYKFNYDPVDNRGTNYDPNEFLLYKEPVFFSKQTDNGADNVGAHGHFAKWLVNNGHRSICVLPCAEGGTAFGPVLGNAPNSNMWKANDFLATRMKDMIISFLNADDNNYLSAFVWQHGEADSYIGQGMDAATYAGHFDTMWSWLVSEVAAGTARNYDMVAEQVPLIVVGMPQQYLESGGYVGTVQDALIDTPNRINYSSFVNMSSYTHTDVWHHSAETNRILGKTLLPAAMRVARKNVPGAVIPTDLTGTIALNETPDSLSANGSASGGTSPITGSILVAEALDSLTASGTLGTAGQASPLTDALGPYVQLKRSEGVLQDGSTVQQWTDQSGNGNHGVPPLPSQEPIWDGTDMSFTTLPFQSPNVTKGLQFTNPIYNITDKWTLIIDFQHDSDSDYHLIFGGTGTYVNWITGNGSGYCRVRATSHGDNDISLPSDFESSKARKWIALTCDVSGNLISLYAGTTSSDGVQVDQITTPNWVNTPDGANAAIGMSAANGNYGSKGKIYNFTVFNDKALTLSQIHDVVSEYA